LFTHLHPWSSQWSLSFWLSHQYPICITRSISYQLKLAENSLVTRPWIHPRCSFIFVIVLSH
jgi:hypothetical protein